MGTTQSSRGMMALKWLVSAGLLALLAWLLAGLAWLILTPETAISADRTAIEVQDPTAVSDDDEDSDFDLSFLTGSNPFEGSETSSQVEELRPEILEDIPESTLDITYKGCVCAGGSGTAFVQVPGKAEISYVNGDEVTSGYTVYSMYPQRLVIERNGSREAVYTREESVITGIERPEYDDEIGTPAGETAETPANAPVRETTASRDPNSLPDRLRTQRTSGNSAESEDGGSFSVKASDLLANATPTRVRSRGLSVGLAFAPTGDRSVLEQAGLKRNDVITAVNGVSFQNINDTEFLEQITNGGVLRLTVQRGNNPDPITVNLTIEKET